MTFNPEKQYRCTIIRGKSKNDMDNLLPYYAHIIESICPCDQERFRELFNRELSRILPSASKKTLDNHRTEIAGKLFGMYYVNEKDTVLSSERTNQLLSDNDQPAFFKNMCFKLQLPSGMDKINKILSDVNNNIHINQCSYLLELLKDADANKVIINMQEVGYYVLNALEVLQGKVSPGQILKTIIERRKKGIQKRLSSGSRANQHIRETLNYLELANLIVIQQGNLILNKQEQPAIDLISSFWDKPLQFNPADYDLDSTDGRKKMYREWQGYYSEINKSTVSVFNTTLKAFSYDLKGLKKKGYDLVEGIDTTALGDEGEIYVFKYEKKRVGEFNPRLNNRVLLLGKTKGLGFDIQSVRADNSSRSDHSLYIEVKSTKRTTVPDPSDSSWSDVIMLTRNEWIAADQHRDSFSLYRVYFTPTKIVLFVINDPVSKNEKGILSAVPEKYRVDFTLKAGVLMG